MTNIEKLKKLETYLIIFLPISMILGNLSINLTILAIVLISSFSFFNLTKTYSKYFIFFLLTLLFLFLLNIYFSVDKTLSTRGMLGILKHILLFVSLLFLFKKDEKNFDKFILSCLLVILFVSTDTLIQFIFGKDIFGHVPQISHGYRLSGPFGDEYVAGSYLSKFFFISLFYFNKIKFSETIKLILYTSFVFIIIFLSSERAAFYLVTLAILFFFIFHVSFQKFKLYFLFGSILLSVIFFSFNDKAKEQHIIQSIYYANLENLPLIDDYLENYCAKKNVVDIAEKEENKSNSCKQKFGYVAINENSFLHSRHGAHFLTSFEIFKNNFLIGSGIKTFRIECSKNVYDKINSKSYKNRCNTHPHQFYLEILSDGGVFFFIIFCSTILLIIFKTFRSNHISDIEKNIIIGLMIILFFPLQTSGSFFSTFNGIFYWIAFAVLFYKLKIKIFE